MELKEMANTGVILTTEVEYDEYTKICFNGGFHKPRSSSKQDVMIYVNSKCGGYVSAGKSFYYGKIDLNDGYRKLITLAQFKERNGIMKYKQGDTLLTKHDGERRILGVCGQVYLVSSQHLHHFYVALTEAQLHEQGFTLKTDEPEMVELTLEDVAKLKGIPVDQLRIKD